MSTYVSQAPTSALSAKAPGALAVAGSSSRCGLVLAQPALALVWSFLLLGERLNERQTIGIAIVLSGLLAFLVMNQRANRVVRR